MSERYQVAWSYCTVKILDEAGQSTIVGFTKDAIVPTSADPQDVKRLVVKGALKKVATDESEPAAKPAASVEPKPKPEPKVDAKTDTKAEPKSAKAG